MYAFESSFQNGLAQGIKRDIHDFLTPVGGWVRAHWTGDRWQRAKPTPKLIDQAFDGRCLLSFEVSATSVIVIDVDAHDAVDAAGKMHLDALASMDRVGADWGWSKVQQRSLVGALCAPVVEGIVRRMGCDVARFRTTRGVHLLVRLPASLGADCVLPLASALEEELSVFETPDVSIEVFPKRNGSNMRMCSFPAMGDQRAVGADCKTVLHTRRADDVALMHALVPADLSWVEVAGHEECGERNTLDRSNARKSESNFSQQIRDLLVYGMANDESWVALRMLAAAFAFAGVPYELAIQRFAEYLEEVEHGSTRAQSHEGRRKLMDSFEWAMKKQCARRDRGEIKIRLRGTLADVLWGRKSFASAKNCATIGEEKKEPTERDRWREWWQSTTIPPLTDAQQRRRNGAKERERRKTLAAKMRASRRRMTSTRIGNVAMRLLGVRATISNRIEIDSTELSTPEIAKISDAFTYDNPDFIKAKRFNLPCWMHPKKIATWRSDGTGKVTLARGSVERLDALLGRVQYDDQTERGAYRMWHECNYPDKSTVELWDHQRRFVETSKEHRICLQRAAAGTGKTTAAIALMAELKRPSLVIVHSTKLMEQWVERVSRELGIRKSDVGIIQGSTRQIRAITIAMQQTLKNCVHEYAGIFGVVIQDEVQFAAANTFLEVIDHMKAEYRIGMSEDERRKDGKEFLIYDLFGKVVSEIAYKDAVDLGGLVESEVRVIPTEFDAGWLKHARIAAVNGKRRNFGLEQSRLLSEMNDAEDRTECVMKHVREELKRGARIVFFNKRREGCKALASKVAEEGFAGGLMIGNQDKGDSEEFERTKRGLLDGSLSFGVGTYQAMGTGIDIPTLDVGVMMHPIAHDKKGEMFFGQVRGRLSRLSEGKNKSVIYYAWDKKVYGKSALRNLCKWCREVFVWENDEWVDARLVLKRRGGNL